MQAAAARATHSFRGTIESIAGRAVDHGGSADSAGVPMIFYRVKVLKALKGGKVGDAVTVAWIDTVVEGATPLTVGATYERMTERLDGAADPVVARFAPLYVPVGADQSVLLVKDGRVEAHGKGAGRLRAGDKTASSWDLDTVEQVLAS